MNECDSIKLFRKFLHLLLTFCVSLGVEKYDNSAASTGAVYILYYEAPSSEAEDAEQRVLLLGFEINTDA